VSQHDATRLLARPAAVDEHVLRRLDPEQQDAELVAVNPDVDQVEAAGAHTFAVVGKTGDGGPAAVAFIDGAQATKAFIERFLRTGTPTIWPCKTIVGITLFGLDFTNPETVRKVGDQPRERWLLATAGDELVDPTQGRVAWQREGV
jgi:hypothetical protein